MSGWAQPFDARAVECINRAGGAQLPSLKSGVLKGRRTSSSRSLHYAFIHRGPMPDDTTRQELDETHLPTDWSLRLTVPRAWGDRWLREGQSALLVVRSVLVPETDNVLVNPRRDAHFDALTCFHICLILGSGAHG
jgi:RES domain